MPAVAHELGCDALAYGALRGGVGQDRAVGVAVRVDKAGTDYLAGGVDHALRPGARQAPHGDDAVALNSHVRRVRGIPRPVGDPAVTDQDIQQGMSSFCDNRGAITPA